MDHEPMQGRFHRLQAGGDAVQQSQSAMAFPAVHGQMIPVNRRGKDPDFVAEGQIIQNKIQKDIFIVKK